MPAPCSIRTFVRPLPKNKYLISIWCAFDVLIWLSNCWTLGFIFPKFGYVFSRCTALFQTIHTYFDFKVQLFLRRPKKFWQNFLVDLMFTYYTLKQWGRFRQFLWSSQKTWTVCPSTLILHQKLGIQIFFYLYISYLLLVLLVFLILLTLLFKCYSNFKALDILLGWI